MVYTNKKIQRHLYDTPGRNIDLLYSSNILNYSFLHQKRELNSLYKIYSAALSDSETTASDSTALA